MWGPLRKVAYIQLETITESGKGYGIFLRKIRLISIDPNMPFLLPGNNFPIRQAFCITINKSSCQTFDNAGIYLSKPVFTHKQLYVAFSRVKYPDEITLFIENNNQSNKNPVLT